MPQVEEGVGTLEQALQSFITSVGIEFNKLYNYHMRTEAELRAFKDGMRVFHKESKGDRKAVHEEIRSLKKESRQIIIMPHRILWSKPVIMYPDF